MPVFIAQAKNGSLQLGDYNAARLKDFLKKNDGIRIRIEPETPENRDQRNFFEGAIVPLIAFYQENMDHRNTDHKRQIHEWLKMEFNAEMVVVNGKAKTIAGSTKGQLAKGLLDKVIDWMTDQGYQTELLNPTEYKYWRDTIYPNGGPVDYISYLLATKKLSK